MPKLKTHSGAKKRFKMTKSGKIKRAHAYKRHQLGTQIKRQKQKRRLRKAAYADVTNMKSIRLLIPYK